MLSLKSEPYVVPFRFIPTDALREILSQLERKNPPLAKALKVKMREVVSRDSQTVDFYKNLRAPLNAFKRGHVGSFVLAFRVFNEQNFILFVDFDHHDRIYLKLLGLRIQLPDFTAPPFNEPAQP